MLSSPALFEHVCYVLPRRLRTPAQIILVANRTLHNDLHGVEVIPLDF